MPENPGDATAESTCSYDCDTGGASALGMSVFYEIVSAALLLYQLTKQYDIWKEDVENLQILAEEYVEIGGSYHSARQGLRGLDGAVYGHAKGLPHYPGVCYSHVEQGRLGALLAVQGEHKKALLSLPAWATGDRVNLNYKAAKSELAVGIHSMAEAENYEENQVDRYEQMRITNLAKSTGGAAVNLSGAFRTVAAIAADNVEKSSAGLNSAFGAFGNAAASLYNKYERDIRDVERKGEKRSTAPAVETETAKQRGVQVIRLEPERSKKLIAPIEDRHGF